MKGGKERRKKRRKEGRDGGKAGREKKDGPCAKDCRPTWLMAHSLQSIFSKALFHTSPLLA